MGTVADLLKRTEVKETVLKTVQLDGQVVLKIMQHCDGALPQIVTGQLLGLDVGQTMEVTDCFPFPVSSSGKIDSSSRSWRAAVAPVAYVLVYKAASWQQQQQPCQKQWHSKQ
jgi:hypothetical protein